MGRKWSNKNRRARNENKSPEELAKETASRSQYKDLPRENETFKSYYKAQGILPDDELDTLFETFQKPLETTFRFTGSRKAAVDLKETMKSMYFPVLEKIRIDDEPIQLPEPIPWYPNELGWQMELSRSVLRKSQDLKEFHRFLVSETEVGNISRQEAVSMIPVFLLDVQPKHYVLDTCASPGSKTAQILEALHADDEGLSGESAP
jgi:16S rRNA C967 or C1407 C5-methylase (RsmB/RsmF family)